MDSLFMISEQYNRLKSQNKDIELKTISSI